MLLITSSSSGGGGGGSPWLQAGKQLQQQQGWPLKLLQVLAPERQALAGAADSGSSAAGSGAELQPLTRAVDADGAWAALHSGCSDVAVLVRPDGHVAWRSLGSSGTAVDAAVARLQQVLQQALQLQPPEQDA